ncbi:MAG: hypothetical protein ACXWCB_18660, partial [Acidimicrobiales bacterium]
MTAVVVTVGASASLMAGLAVMLVAGVVAGPYTPSWFDGTEACTRTPCAVDVDPQLALRVLS